LRQGQLDCPDSPVKDELLVQIAPTMTRLHAALHSPSKLPNPLSELAQIIWQGNYRSSLSSAAKITDGWRWIAADLADKKHRAVCF